MKQWAEGIYQLHADGSVWYVHPSIADTPDWVRDSETYRMRHGPLSPPPLPGVAIPQSGARPVAHRKQNCDVCCGSGTVMTGLGRVEPCPAVGCPFRQVLVYQECVDGKWVDISKQRYDYLSSDRRCLRVVGP